jgi:hypothetical protein
MPGFSLIAVIHRALLLKNLAAYGTSHMRSVLQAHFTQIPNSERRHKHFYISAAGCDRTGIAE